MTSYRLQTPFTGYRGRNRNNDKWDFDPAGDGCGVRVTRMLFAHLAGVPWHSQYGVYHGDPAFRFKRGDLKLKPNVLYYRLRVLAGGRGEIGSVWAPLLTLRGKPIGDVMTGMQYPTGYEFPDLYRNRFATEPANAGERAAEQKCLRKINGRIRRAIAAFERRRLWGWGKTEIIIPPAVFPYSHSRGTMPCRSWRDMYHVPKAHLRAVADRLEYAGGWRLKA